MIRCSQWLWVAVVVAGVAFVDRPVVGQAGSASPRAHGPFLTVPARPQDLFAALQRLAAANRTALGIEVVGEPTGPGARAVQGASSKVLDLTGLSVREALGLMLGSRIEGPVPSYEWAEDRGVTHVRPSLFRNNRQVALNRIVSVDLRAEGVLDALHAVRRLIDSNVPEASPRPPSRASASVRQHLDRPIAFALQDVPIRQVLDEIVRAQGASSWTAEYQDVAGSAKGLRLSIRRYNRMLWIG